MDSNSRRRRADAEKFEDPIPRQPKLKGLFHELLLHDCEFCDQSNPLRCEIFPPAPDVPSAVPIVTLTRTPLLAVGIAVAGLPSLALGGSVVAVVGHRSITHGSYTRGR